MKKTGSVLLLILHVTLALQAQNPFITHMYTADPSARVFQDTLYVYPSHDGDTATWFNMVDWHVLSTTDMKHWTDHGVALSLNDLKWGFKYAWAPDCAYKNGKYYFYYPVAQDYIGVAVGDRPYGPFTDPLGKPLITRQTPGVVNNRDLIDPCIFVDDDGSAYLIFGQNDVNIVKLNDDMVSFTDTVQVLKGTDHFFEAVWMHKYNGKYYLSYSGEGKILYAMADNPYGPYTFKGTILKEMNSLTNHHSIVAYKGRWYLFYHNSDLYFSKHPEDNGSKGWQGIHPFRRSICVDDLYYNPDGTIQEVVPTKEGVDLMLQTTPSLMPIENSTNQQINKSTNQQMTYPPAFTRFYDLIYHQIRDEVDTEFFLKEIGNTSGRILETGVGTGRLFSKALEQGADVYGLDCSTSMIETLLPKLPPEHRHRVSLQDIRDFSYDKGFDLIIAPFRVFQHLTEKEDQFRALHNIYRHLNPGGRFIFDVFVPDPAFLKKGMDKVVDFEGEYLPGKRVRRIVSSTPDLIGQRIQADFRMEWEEEDGWHSEDWSLPLRIFFRYELEHLIERSEFETYSILGDYKGNVLSRESKDFIVVCGRG